MQGSVQDLFRICCQIYMDLDPPTCSTRPSSGTRKISGIWCSSMTRSWVWRLQQKV